MTFPSAWKVSNANRIVLDQLLNRADACTELMKDFWRMMILCFDTPRPSTDYDGTDMLERSVPIRNAIRQVCVDRNLCYREDTIFNIVVSNNPGKKALVCFQGHMDVVVSKNESVEHNFETEGVDVQITPQGTLKPVKGITLGADNGVAIAAGLAILANNPSIPLELLITQNEETCFSGALGVDVSLISADTMLNLDSEVEGAICVGSAGGFEQHFTLPINRESIVRSDHHRVVNVKIRELKGGHSGIDIDKEKLNGILAINRLLIEAMRQDPSIRIVNITGGTSSNAIPRECSATVIISTSALNKVEGHFQLLKAECISNEPDCQLIVTEDISCLQCMSADSSRRLIQLLAALPNGVIRRIIKTGDIECSLNLGLIRTNMDDVVLKFLVRSTCVSWMKYFSHQLTAIGELAGARVAEYVGPFGAWEPKFDSPILKTLVASFPGTASPKMYSVHAGLESSTIMERFHDAGRSLDCASIGPQIEHAHSPDECLFIDSATQFVNWVDAFVKQL
jgi:dipeptidase D